MLRQWFVKPHMLRRITVLLLSVILMGFCVAIFQQISFGTDPCAVMTQGLHRKSGIGYGTCQVIVNLVVLVAITAMKDIRSMGLGTLANMLLVGYSAEIFFGLFDALCPMGGWSLLGKTAIFLPTMALFLIAVSFYTVVDLGTAPYDALPQVIAAKRKIPFAPLRMAWDILCTVIGFFLGGTVGVVTLFVCFFMGPVISWIAAKFKRLFA